MAKRSSIPSPDPYDALADALRAVVEDMADRIAASVVAAVRPMVEGDTAVMVSIPEAARRLGLGTTKLKELIAAGEIPSVKVGERRLVPVSGLEEWSAG